MGKRRKKGAAVSEKAPASFAAQATLDKQPSNEQKAPRKTLSLGRKVLFLLITAVVFPSIAILLAELTLRAVGYGFSPAFFIEQNWNGKRVLTDNPKFGWRFFPPTIARRPHDFVIPADKPRDTFRIFVFGESAAWGDPDPSFGMARILEKLLADQFPGLKFEVVNSAMAAISSHVVYQIASEAAERDPDAFVVYMGNNEVIGPFGPGTVFSSSSGSISLIRAAVWLKGQALVQLLANLKTAVEGKDRQPQAWEGMQMFEQNKIRSDDPRLVSMYKHFRRNLHDIIEAGKDAGAGVVVCNMAANFGQWGPHASLHRPGLTTEEQKRWDEAFEAGVKSQEHGDWQTAIQHLIQAEKIDATYAELQFRLGRCHERLQQFEDAKRHYAKAVDEDCLRFRTDSRENQIIREIAESEKVSFLDVRRRFEEESPYRIPGLNLLDDHVHMNFHGNYLIARALMAELAAIVQEKRGVTPRSPQTPLSEKECAVRLAYTGYNQARVAERNLQRVKNPPFTSQPDHDEHLAYFERVLDELSTHTTPEGLKSAAREFATALQRAPNDWVLYENFADLCQRGGNSPEETKALRRLLELLPHHEERYAWLGQSLLNQGQLEEAATCYRRAIAYDPSNNNAYAGLGAALVRQGKVEEGLQQFEAAVRARPGLAESHNELGEAYYRADKLPDAERAFREAIRLNPDYALAHTNLGVVLLSKGSPEDSIPHFRQALESRPDFADALRHLGNIYLSSGRGNEALALYENAIRSNPNSAELHSNLAGVYARLGRLEEAIGEMETAVKLRPDVVPARKNLSRLLVQAGRKADAAAQLREAIRRVPQDQEAQAALKALESGK